MLQANKDDFLQILISKLQYLNYSESTITSYYYYVSEFLESVDVSPSKLSNKDIQSYLDSYVFSSTSKQNQVISALKIFWEKALGKKYLKVDFTRPRKEKRLPRVIDKGFLVDRILRQKDLMKCVGQLHDITMQD